MTWALPPGASAPCQTDPQAWDSDACGLQGHPLYLLHRRSAAMCGHCAYVGPCLADAMRSGTADGIRGGRLWMAGDPVGMRDHQPLGRRVTA